MKGVLTWYFLHLFSRCRPTPPPNKAMGAANARLAPRVCGTHRFKLEGVADVLHLLQSRYLTNTIKEARVVGVEVADIIDTVLQEGDALGAHAEGETAVLGGIVATVAQDKRIDHPGAQDLQPASVLANRAALAIAQQAGDIHLDARLGEREVALAETHGMSLTIDLAGKIGNHALQIAECNPLAHGQTFDLIEHRFRARSNRLIAIALARQNHANRLGRVLTH